MPGLLFVSQAMLDTWAEQGKIGFVGNVMTLLAGEGQGRSYELEPAVRFMKLVGSETDPNALLAKVKTVAQLRDMGAEQVEGSVILGDAAYEVQPGFLAEVSALQAAAAAQRRPEVRADGVDTRGPPPAVAENRRSTAAGEAPGRTAVGPPAGQLPRSLEDRRKEAEALARFLLDNLA